MRTRASVTCARDLPRTGGTLRTEDRRTLPPRGVQCPLPHFFRHFAKLFDLLVECVNKLRKDLVDRQQHRYEDDSVLAYSQRIQLRGERFQPLFDDVSDLPSLPLR